MWIWATWESGALQGGPCLIWPHYQPVIHRAFVTLGYSLVSRVCNCLGRSQGVAGKMIVCSGVLEGGAGWGWKEGGVHGPGWSGADCSHPLPSLQGPCKHPWPGSLPLGWVHVRTPPPSLACWARSRVWNAHVLGSGRGLWLPWVPARGMSEPAHPEPK